MHYLCTRVSQIPHIPGSPKAIVRLVLGRSGGNRALYGAWRHPIARFADASGRLPEWLGIGLQNRGQQFESATDLTKMPPASGIFY